MKQLDISTEANRLLEESGSFSAPVDLNKIADFLGITIHSEPLEEEVSGMLIVASGNKHIIVNSAHHQNRKRFTIAHEMGHLNLHHKSGDGLFFDKKMAIYNRRGTPSDPLYSDANSTTNPDQERQANAFAASLLMPEALIRNYIDGRQLDISDEFDVALISNAFGVSEQAMSIRLRNLKLIDFNS